MIDSPDHSPGFLLWHVTLRWQRDVASALKPLGLTHVQFVLLATTWWLNERGEQPSQAALAARAGTDVKMTSQVVRTLERNGLVVRAADEADTRARRLTVTAAGGRAARTAIELVEAVDRELLEGLSPTAGAGFVRALGSLAGRS